MKKGHVIFSGGGDIKDTFQLDEKFFSMLKSNSRILYIPIALNRDRIGFEACYDWFSNVVSSHAGDKDIDFSMILEDDEIPDLVKYEALYIGGGNTFKLLDYMVRKDLSQKIIKYIEQGGIVYGGSAGAIVMGKDIRTVDEENDKNYKYINGLNLIRGLSLICHYEASLDERITKSANNLNSPIIALPENAGIILGPNDIEIVGEVFIFDKNGKRYLTPELMINLP